MSAIRARAGQTSEESPEDGTTASDATPPTPNDHRETMEWLGLMPADFMVYASAAAVISIYFVQSILLDAMLSLGAVALSFGALALGLRPDPQVTLLVKRLKRVSYAAWAGMAVFLIAAHYLWWSR